MKSQLLKKNILILFTLFVSDVSFGQVEYFVKVNPATCSYTIIDSLSGVKWIAGGATFDKINKRYIFRGEDINHNSYLYSIDAVDGSIISNPVWTNYFSLVKFDNSTGILYGIHWTSTLAAGADFVSINPADFTYTIINTINISGLTGNVTFDNINHKFIFIGNDSIGNKCLFSVNAITGNVITKPTLSSSIGGIQFDNSSGNLYGLKWDSNLQTTSFVSIDIANGNITTINTIPSVNSNYDYSTFDEINKRYTFVWTNSSSNNYLYTINALDGNVITNPVFPVFVSPYNLLEFKYDNSTGELYALHWGPIDEFNGIKETYNLNLVNIYPNPSNSTFTIQLPTLQTFNLSVLDITGHNIYENKNATGTINIDASGFSSGIYFVKAVNQRTVLAGKLVKE